MHYNNCLNRFVVKSTVVKLLSKHQNNAFRNKNKDCFLFVFKSTAISGNSRKTEERKNQVKT